MNYFFSGAMVYDIEADKFASKDIIVRDGHVSTTDKRADYKLIDCKNKYIFPGFTDVHVHLREPGFSYKETIKTGTAAAAHGGYTTVFAMPNVNPPPDCIENLAEQTAIIKRDAVIKVVPFGTITKGSAGIELSDMEAMAPYVAGFSDDGRGVQSEELMLAAMKESKRLGKIISAHCEDNNLLCGGYIHEGEYAKRHGHRGISSESEWKMIERDLELARETGCKYHVCHISAAKSVELIRKAKAAGVDVTCETAPHYLLLNDMDICEDGRFKMNPPIRSENDRQALIEGIKDGTVDMIATDHAPHSAEEKARGLKDSLMGVTGLESSFPMLYTKLVKTGVISLEKLIKLMSINPCKRFGINKSVLEGSTADFTVFSLSDEYIINEQSFLSKGKSTPFSGETVYGKCNMTVYGGKIIWQE